MAANNSRQDKTHSPSSYAETLLTEADTTKMGDQHEYTASSTKPDSQLMAETWATRTPPGRKRNWAEELAAELGVTRPEISD